MTATFTKSDVAVTNSLGQLILAGQRDTSTNQLYLIDLHGQPAAHRRYKSSHRSVVPYDASLPTANRFDLLQEEDSESAPDDMLDIPPAQHASASSISDPTSLSANESIYVKRKAAKQVEHMHAALFSPIQSTFLNAAHRGYLSMLPGVTSSSVRSHPVNAIATAQGHLDRTRQGLRSTKRTLSLSTTDVPLPIDVESPDISLRYSDPKIYTRSFAPGTIHADATAPFPVKSVSGNEFINVFYIEGANFIKPVAMSSNSAASNIAAFDGVISYCQSHGLIPDFVRLDNNTSTALELYLRERNIAYQYVPPGNHRANKAERAIRTFKSHFIGGLCSADSEFDLALWDHLLPQATLTLNLLRPSALDPLISAWQQLEGSYDYNAHPIHRPGCKVVSFVDPASRGPYSPHGDVGFYLGPAMDHYRCFHIWIPSTRAYRISDTVSWHPEDTFVPDTDILVSDPPTPVSDPATIASDISTVSVPTQPSALDATRPSSFSSGDRAVYLHDAINMYLLHESVQPTLVTTLRSIQHQLFVSTHGATPPAFAQRVPETTMPASQRVPDTAMPAAQRVPPSPVGDYYDIDHIVRHRSLRGQKPFLVKWAGYDDSFNTWEPRSSIEGTVAFQTYVTLHPRDFPLSISPTLILNMPVSNLSTKTRRRRRARNQASAAVVDGPPSPLSRQSAEVIAQQMHSALQHDAPFSSDPCITEDRLQYTCCATTYDPTTGDPLKWSSAIHGPHRDNWMLAMDAEFERLFVTNDTMQLIHLADIPPGRLISYFNPQLKMKLNAELEWIFRIRGTYGGDRSDYTGDKSAYTADMPTVKILLNRTVSDPIAKFMTADIVDMYLHTRLLRKEYMCIDLKFMSPVTRKRFNVDSYVLPDSTKVYVEISGGIYGLPQAGILAQQKLVSHLNAHGYHQASNTTCLFRHQSLPIEFTLVVDDFGISYKSQDSAEHLVRTLRLLYPIKVDWTGSTYLGYTIEDAGSGKDRTISLSMPRYVDTALKRFNFVPTHNVHSPEKFTVMSYASKDAQLTPAADTSDPLSPSDKTRVQSIVGVLLYYARAVDGTMLGACNRIASQQANPTQKTLAAAHHLLGYAATYPNAKLVYRPSDMILRMDSDASYNSETGARSRASYCAWLGKANDPTFINGFIDVVSALIPTVVSVASEAEYAALFIAGKGGLPLRNTLNDIDCIQPPTIITTDNSVAKGIATNTCKARRSKSIDMRYHWLRDRVALKDFDIVWQPGIDSLADFNTKVQPVAQVLKMRSYYVQDSGPRFPNKFATTCLAA